MTIYTNDRPLRTTTRSIATAEAIRDGVPFRTGGSFYGATVASHYVYEGILSGADERALHDDNMAGRINYVVVSYSTPIAWRLYDGSWYTVTASFSVTTSKHQGNLYLVPRANHDTHLSPVGHLKGEKIIHRWRVECDTCGTVVSLHEYKRDAYAAEHSHKINGRHPAQS